MQSFVMALRSIGANKMRAVLTMLGIIIGVMALVVLVSLVSGTTDSVTGAVSDLGTSLVTVTVSDDKGKPIHLSDLDDWTKEPDIGLISARTSSTVVGKHGADYDSVTVYGTTPSTMIFRAFSCPWAGGSSPPTRKTPPMCASSTTPLPPNWWATPTALVRKSP